MPVNSWVMQDAGQYFIDNQQYYTQFEIEAEAFEHIFIGGSVKTMMYARDNYRTFKPFVDEYMFYTGLRFGPIEAGFRHFCTHPVVTYMGLRDTDIKYEGAYEQIYLRVEVEYGK